MSVDSWHVGCSKDDNCLLVLVLGLVGLLVLGLVGLVEAGAKAEAGASAGGSEVGTGLKLVSGGDGGYELGLSELIGQHGWSWWGWSCSWWG